MNEELKKVYEEIRESRVTRSRQLYRWEGARALHLKECLELDIEFIAEELIRKSEFGMKDAQLISEYLHDGISICTEGRVDRDINETNIREYAKNFLEKNLGKFGETSIVLEPYYDWRHPYNWIASFKPNQK